MTLERTAQALTLTLAGVLAGCAAPSDARAPSTSNTRATHVAAGPEAPGVAANERTSKPHTERRSPETASHGGGDARGPKPVERSPPRPAPPHH